MHIRCLVGEADYAVALPFVAPFRQPPLRGIASRGVKAGAEATDLATNQILFAAVHRAQHDIGLTAAHAGRKRMGDDLQLNVVVPAQKFSEPRHQPMGGECRANRQFDHAAGILTGRRCGGLGAQRRGGHYLGVLVKFPPLRCQRESVGGSRKQPSAKLRLKCRDLAAHGWMTGAQTARRPGEAPGIGNRDECLAQIPIHGVSSLRRHPQMFKSG